jgi:hypothetical protein
MKPLPKLDSNCAKILAVLMFRDEVRFKDLKQILAKYNMEIPEATLLMHLNHLIKSKLVLKTIKSPKNVTYKANMEKLKEVQTKFRATSQYVKDWQKFKEIFLNKPVKEQIGQILINTVSCELAYLKHKILFEKYGKFADGLLAELFQSYFLRIPHFLVIKKCMENEEYMNAFLEQLERDLEKIVKGESIEG